MHDRTILIYIDMYMYAHSCLKPLSNEQNSTFKHEIYVLLNNT